MTKRSRRHLDDYQLNEEGAYEYRGTYWHWGRPEARDAFLRPAWGLVAGGAAALVVVGFIPARALGVPALAVLPYMLSWVALALTVTSLVRLAREGERVRGHVHDGAVETLAPKAWAACFAAFASCIGVLLGIVLGEPDLMLALPFAAFMAAAGICMAQLARRAGRLRLVQG